VITVYACACLSMTFSMAYYALLLTTAPLLALTAPLLPLTYYCARVTYLLTR